MARSPAHKPPPGPVAVGSALVAVAVIAALTGVGIAVGYAMALLVINVGMLSPKVFVAVPLVLVGAAAWAFAGSSRGPISRLFTVLVAGGVAISLLATLDTRNPTELFTRTGEITHIDNAGEPTTRTYRTKTSMKHMPGFADIAGLAALLASLAVGCACVARPLFDRFTEPRRQPSDRS